ncbi:MAG: YDG domain-containing protein, partial [Aliarcobacter sp.]|nr:YDG domain-containing protein [Aliarcobacter sp.]
MNRLIDFSSRFRILKGGKISLVVSAFLGGAIIANAAPSGGVVTSGNTTINQSGNITNINQSTQKASINWNDFSVKSNETVNFNQPNVNSITLNRVIGNKKSVIDGALNANGQVWILNSNGILFGKNASVNTAGLLATTGELSDADFQNGKYNFKNSSSNSVINLGTIKVENSSYVVLAGNEVQNGGNIEAIKGKVHLVGANEYSINLNGNSLVNLKVNKGVLDAMVSNSGNILANGGEIFLTTNAVDELLKGVVNNTGVIEANSLDGITGKVELFAHSGEVQVGGSITALDGFVETSGKEFTIDKNAKVKAKTWLIDPTNLTVNDATAYETALNGGADVIIQTNNAIGSDEGNIYINDTIDWSTAQKLTLNAYKNIYINSAITASNAGGKVALYYGQGAVATGNTATYGFGLGSSGFAGKINLQAGNNFFTKLGSNGSETTWTVVNTANALMNISKTGNSVLGADVSASGIANWTPIGDDSTKFTGKFDGLGHTVDALTINNSSLQNVGLFGHISGATIKNIGVTNVDITATLGGTYVGGLVGLSTDSSTVSNAYSTGSVTGGNGCGYSACSHSGFHSTYAQIGGLVGMIENNSILSNSYSTATVTGGNYVTVGGLVGLSDSGNTVSNSYATGSATGGADSAVGGLFGGIQINTTVSNSYSTGSVTSGSGYVGGLVGYWYDSNTVSNSYATGSVTGGSGANKGGLIGLKDGGGTVTNSFYDKTKVTGMSDAATYGKTTQEMQTLSTFSGAGWSIELDSTKNRIYPYLTFDENNNPIWKIGKYAIALNYTLGIINTTYNGSNQLLTDFWTNSIFGASGSSLVAGTDYKFVYDSSDTTSFKNAGTYSDISVVILNANYALDSEGNTAGSFVIAQKALTVTGTTASNKTYDGTIAATVATLGTLNGFVGSETVTASATGTFDSKNAGDRTATFTYTLADGENGGLASNYSIANSTDNATIAKKDLGVTYAATNKTYDGTTDVTVTESTDDIVSGDSVNISETASMENKNVGNGKTVNVSSIALSGDDSSNYNLTNTTATTTVDIAKK